MLHTRNFRCMTTDIEILLCCDDVAAAGAALSTTEVFFRTVENRFSRFIPDSELMQLNRTGLAGQPVPVSDDFAELVQLALAAAELSAGVFDPTVIDALEAAGYDRSIDLIRAGGGTAPRALGGTWQANRWHGMRVEQKNGRWQIVRETGQRLDLGGIAKGWAVDRAADMLQPLGHGLVNAGGDLRAWGDQPGAQAGDGWLVAVDNPSQSGTDVTWLHALNRAVATSSTASRRWNGGHHLIDPRNGRPADTDLLTVTVVGPTAANAEVCAKVALVLGRRAGLAWLAGVDQTEALLIGTDGQFYGTRNVNQYLT